MTKKVGDRHWAVLQAFAFLREYGALRGCAQASLGRPAWRLQQRHTLFPISMATHGGALCVDASSAHLRHSSTAGGCASLCRGSF